MTAQFTKALRFYPGKRFAAWVYPRWIKTSFYDGSSTIGMPPGDPHFAESARYLGYGDDIYWHMVEHDLLHAYVAEELNMDHSGALWAQAHGWTGGEMPVSGKQEEERLTYLQRTINGLPADDNSWYQHGYTDLRKRLGSDTAIFNMVRHFRVLLRPGGEAMTEQWAREKA